MSTEIHSAGRRVKIYGALTIFSGMALFFGAVLLGGINSFLLVLSGLLFVGGFIVFIVGRFMD